MNTMQVGRKAEAQAAVYLQSQGFQILNQNWRTRYCEIDIVATKGNTVYFVEIKYRSRLSQGSGFDYITATKLRQMRFAANFWMACCTTDKSYELAAVEVTPVNLRFVLI